MHNLKRVAISVAIILLGFGLFIIVMQSNYSKPLSLPPQPAVGDVVLSGTFDRDYEICVFEPYSRCGRLCTVEEGNIFVATKIEDKIRWSMTLDSVFQFSRGGYREVRYYNTDTCLAMTAGERFVLSVSSVKNAGSDVEVSIDLKRRVE